jgi:DNA-binding SARP family transcriptional activator
VRLRSRLLAGIERAVEVLWQAGRREDVVELARAGLQRDSYDEALHKRLFESLVALGRRADALEAWQHYEAVVVGELGFQPSRSMRALFDALVGGD